MREKEEPEKKTNTEKSKTQDEPIFKGEKFFLHWMQLIKSKDMDHGYYTW